MSKHSYSENKAHCEPKGGSGPELKDEIAAVVLAQLLDTLSSLGFSADEDISGADAVDAISEAYAVAVERLKGTSGEPCVIFSQSEDGFWNKDIGWGDASSATHYFMKPAQLPNSSAGDAQLVPLSAGGDPQTLASSTEEVYTGYVTIDGARAQLDFSVPPGSSQQALDAAAFGALAMVAEVNYVQIG